MQPPQGYVAQPEPSRQPQVPQKKNKLGWILGGAGAATVLIVVLLFAGCAAVADAVKNGGSNEEKAQAMIAKADDLPQSDWQLVERSDPDTGCLSTDIACVRLNATWSVNHKVGLEDTAGGWEWTSAARPWAGTPVASSPKWRTEAWQGFASTPPRIWTTTGLSGLSSPQSRCSYATPRSLPWPDSLAILQPCLPSPPRLPKTSSTSLPASSSRPSSMSTAACSTPAWTD